MTKRDHTTAPPVWQATIPAMSGAPTSTPPVETETTTGISNWRSHPDFHPAFFIQEEMNARNWTRDRMAVAMSGTEASDPAIMRLELDLYLDVGPSDTRLRLGGTARAIADAFGLSHDFFMRLEQGWLSANGIDIAETRDELQSTLKEYPDETL